MKIVLFLTSLLLAAAPVHAYDLNDVLDRDTVSVTVPADAKWLGVAAGQLGFGTGTGSSEELATWRAVLACEEGDIDDCTDFAAIEIASGNVVAVAYCADGYYDYYPAVAASENEKDARKAAIQAADEWISVIDDDIADEDIADEEGVHPEEDEATTVMVCASVVIKATR